MKNDKFSLPFEGIGRYSYRRNIEWFAEEKEFLQSIMPQCCGLKIEFIYNEYEPASGMLVENEKADIIYDYKKGYFSIHNGKFLEITHENLVRLEFEDESYFDEN